VAKNAGCAGSIWTRRANGTIPIASSAGDNIATRRSSGKTRRTSRQGAVEMAGERYACEQLIAGQMCGHRFHKVFPRFPDAPARVFRADVQRAGDVAEGKTVLHSEQESRAIANG